MDDKIKQKLEDLSPEFNPDHWEAMSSRLDATIDAEMDTAIRSKLDAVESTIPASGFESFESFIERSDQSWDSEVKSKLDDVKVGGSPQWTLFSQKLDAFKKMRRDHYGLRIAEAILILLLFWTIHQYDHLWKSAVSTVAFESNTDNHSSSSNSLSNDEITTEPKTPSHKNVSASSENNGSSNKESGMASKSSASSSSSRSATKDAGFGSTTSSSTTSNEATDYNDINSSSSTEQTLTEVAQGDQVNSASDSQAMLPAENDVFNEDRSYVGSSIFGVLDPLSLASSPLVFSRGHSLSIIPQLFLDKKENNGGSRAPIWVSLMVNGGINQITTPSTDTFGRSVDYTPTFGAGILVEFENGRWFLGSGLEFHTTDIRPNRSVLYGNMIDGFALVTYESARLNFYSIPILVRYNFVEKGRNIWFANAGVRLHASSRIKYDFTIENDFPNQANIDEIDAYDIHGVSETHFNYFTLNLGVGYQRAIHRNMSAFMSTGVELFGQTNSLFPSQEVINVLRADIGLRYRL